MPIDWSENRDEVRGIFYSDGVFVPLEKYTKGKRLFSIYATRPASDRKRDLARQKQHHSPIIVSDAKKVEVKEEFGIISPDTLIEEMVECPKPDSTKTLPDKPLLESDLVEIVRRTLLNLYPREFRVSKMKIGSESHITIELGLNNIFCILLHTASYRFPDPRSNTSKFESFLKRRVEKLLDMERQQNESVPKMLPSSDSYDDRIKTYLVNLIKKE